MKVHLIKKQTITDFIRKYPGSRMPFEDWLHKLRFVDWQQPADMKLTYNSVDILGKGTNRAVFDIGGNNFRIICKYVFGIKQVHLFVCWIGTHAAYDKICKTGEQYTINIY